ncbi:MAG: sulfur dioxygenase [Patiriisocius sp.]|jgi:sulfur dioxygenase
MLFSGDAATAYKSLFDNLLKLPSETAVYPGHDYNGRGVTMIGEERAHNPRLQVKSVEEYVVLMDSLDLPDPKSMDIAVLANQACGQLDE